MIHVSKTAGYEGAGFTLSDIQPRSILFDISGTAEVHLQRLWEDNVWRATKAYQFIVGTEASGSFECVVSKGKWRVKVISGTATIQVNV